MIENLREEQEYLGILWRELSQMYHALESLSLQGQNKISMPTPIYSTPELYYALPKKDKLRMKADEAFLNPPLCEAIKLYQKTIEAVEERLKEIEKELRGELTNL